MATRLIEVGGLSGLARAFDQIGDVLGQEAQKGLNEVATNSLKRLIPVFDTEIDGGPVSFTRVSEKGRSSVSMRRGRYVAGNDEASADIHVNPIQSKYLKHLLGEGPVRHAGESGAAEEWNYIPMEDAFPYLDDQGVDPVHGQSLRRGTLTRLFKRAAAQKKKIAEARAKGVDPKPTGPLKYGRVFFGKMGTNRTQGVYEQTVGRTQKLKLLILAVKQSKYQRADGYLVPGWNRSVEEAMATYPMRMQRRLREEIARIASSSTP